jgi:predicted transcriptional regulator
MSISPNDPTPENLAEGNPSPLDTAFDDLSSKEQIYSALVQTREPTSAQDIAERADCHTDTARKYLDWFAQLDIATRYDSRPTTYERNEAYFQWRYVNPLAENYTIEKLHENVQTLRDRLIEYREKYGTEEPETVNTLDVETDESIGDVWNDLTDWTSIQEEFRLHERARQLLTEPPDSNPSDIYS